MIKRIIVTTLVVILVGATGVAAYDAYQGNSTLDLSTGDLFAAGQGQGNGGQGQGQGQGGGQAQGQDGSQAQTQGHGRGGQGQGQRGQLQDQGGQGQQSGLPQTTNRDWVTLTGQIVSSAEQNLTVKTAEMGQVVVQLGPPDFASQQNVAFAAGEMVTMIGFSGENSTFQAGQITNDTTAQTLMLRDLNGRPLWAGRGQGGGSGAGQGQGQDQPGQSF